MLLCLLVFFYYYLLLSFLLWHEKTCYEEYCYDASATIPTHTATLYSTLLHWQIRSKKNPARPSYAEFELIKAGRSWAKKNWIHAQVESLPSLMFNLVALPRGWAVWMARRKGDAWCVLCGCVCWICVLAGCVLAPDQYMRQVRSFWWRQDSFGNVVCLNVTNRGQWSICEQQSIDWLMIAVLLFRCCYLRGAWQFFSISNRDCQDGHHVLQPILSEPHRSIPWTPWNPLQEGPLLLRGGGRGGRWRTEGVKDRRRPTIKEGWGTLRRGKTGIDKNKIVVIKGKSTKWRGEKRREKYS